jgi:hypothetical protein
LPIAEPVAKIMAHELGEGKEWVQEHLEAFHELASNYVIKN